MEVVSAVRGEPLPVAKWQKYGIIGLAPWPVLLERVVDFARETTKGYWYLIVTETAHCGGRLQCWRCSDSRAWSERREEVILRVSNREREVERIMTARRIFECDSMQDSGA